MSPASSWAAALVTTRLGLPRSLSSPPAVPASRHRTESLSASGWRSMERILAATMKDEEACFFFFFPGVCVCVCVGVEEG